MAPKQVLSQAMGPFNSCPFHLVYELSVFLSLSLIFYFSLSLSLFHLLFISLYLFKLRLTLFFSGRWLVTRKNNMQHFPPVFPLILFFSSIQKMKRSQAEKKLNVLLLELF